MIILSYNTYANVLLLTRTWNINIFDFACHIPSLLFRALKINSVIATIRLEFCVFNNMYNFCIEGL